MKRPTKKEIKEAVDKLKDKPSGGNPSFESKIGKPAPKHSSQRIRKQGI